MTNLFSQVMIVNTMTGIRKESNKLSTTTRGRKRPVRDLLRDDLPDDIPDDIPDSLIKDIFNDEEIHMAADNLLHIREEDLDEYDESSDGDNSNSFNYSLKDFGLGSCSSGASEEGSTSGRGGGTSSSGGTANGKRRYKRSSEGQGGSQSCGDDANEGNGSEASEKSRGRGDGYDGKRKQVLSARERNLRRLESNERERQRMHSLNDAFQVSIRFDFRKKMHCADFILVKFYAFSSPPPSPPPLFFLPDGMECSVIKCIQTYALKVLFFYILMKWLSLWYFFDIMAMLIRFISPPHVFMSVNLNLHS